MTNPQALLEPSTPPGPTVPSLPTPWRVDAVIPTYNRPADTANLLADLASLETPPGTRLRVLVVDNASNRPASSLPPPAGLDVNHLRLEANRGGSGGFAAGIAAAMAAAPGAGGPHHLLWLLDSDARVEPGTLAALLRVLDARPDAVVAGSALCDPLSGEVFEVGGRLCRRTGELRQFTPADAPAPDPTGAVGVEYVAACSMIVRAAAAQRAGLPADLFVNGDDVEWCLRLARRTGGAVVAVPASRVRHPRPDRMRTWDRFYAARNTFALIEAARLGRRVRRRRAAREVGRALAQAMVGRDDLARLHLLGLREALAGRVTGPGPAPARDFEPFRPLEDLAAALADAPGPIAVGLRRDGAPLRNRVVEHLRRTGRPWSDLPQRRSPALALARLLLGPPRGTAVVSARARPEDRLAARTLVTVCPQGFVARRLSARDRRSALLAFLWRGASLARRLGRSGPGATPPVDPVPGPPAAPRRPALSAPLPSLSIVILAYNRPEALRRTLRALRSDPLSAGAQTLVADNASVTPLAAALAGEFPEVKFVRLPRNEGVAGFQAGVELAAGEVVLLLDDDAIPDPVGLRSALEALATDPGAAAATLAPRHPWTDAPEWPFLDGPVRTGKPPVAHPPPLHDRWPVMGCANLVRRRWWDLAGGYEPSFFLYRNDADLALKLLAAGARVLADPAWVVWHDSPAAARKSGRWFHLATRNWAWMCRRHAPGPLGLAAAVLGWAWAHRLAGIRPADHLRAARGAWEGLLGSPPPLPPGLRADPAGVRRLLALRRVRV